MRVPDYSQANLDLPDSSDGSRSRDQLKNSWSGISAERPSLRQRSVQHSVQMSAMAASFHDHGFQHPVSGYVHTVR